MSEREPIAIVGMGCRLADGISTPEQFWALLDEGREAVAPFPERWDRWNIDTLSDASGRTFARHGGFLRDAEHFDAAFFGLSPREAMSLDPQQRLVLEVAWEALERANVPPDSLAGTNTGVFLGAMTSDYDVAGRWDAESGDGYKVTGNALSLISGRLSYTLGLTGPALTIDTACSSAIVALRLACDALRSGECDVALAGGVCVMSTPQIFLEFVRMNAQAQDGRSKSFSDLADGSGWAEGCGVLVLKTLSAAERAGDRVLALVRGTAVSQDGRSKSLTAPNGLAQQRMLRDALADARLTPDDVDVIEAHATGTSLGDRVEGGALAEVFAEREHPLHLGSCKSNFGHTQAAAGAVSIIKMVLALGHERLPRTLHVERPSTRIDWAGSPLELLSAARPWPRSSRVRRAGVSAFGISGTNAHVILEEAPVEDGATDAPDGLAHPLLLSGVDEPALRAQAERWAGWLADGSSASMRDIAHTAAGSRTHLDVRTSVLAASAAAAVDGLRALAAGDGHDAVLTGVARERSGVVFVFPGQGAYWPGMGRALLEQSPVFRQAVEACDVVLRAETGRSVLPTLRGDGDADRDAVARTDVVQTATFAMYVGLAAVWRRWGVEPSAVVGHSQGEVAAAVVSGALSLADGARVVARRSRAVAEHAGPGAMGLVERPVEEVRARIAPYGSALSVAVVNTARSCVVAGDGDAVDRLLAEMADTGAFSQRVEVDYASHSAHMDALLPGLRADLSGIAPGAARVAFWSSVTGERCSGPELDAEYWCRNLREPVRFDRALAGVLAAGHDVFVEVSPHPVLGVALRDAGGESAVAGSLRRGHGGVDQLWRGAAELHTQGYPVDWARVLGGRGARKVDVPTYAFQRERFWLDGPAARPTAAATGQLPADHPWLGAMTTVAGTSGYLFTGRLAVDEHPWLAEHVVDGDVHVPAAGLLDVALSVAHATGARAVAELTMLEPLVLGGSGAVRLQVTVGDPDGRGRRAVAVHSQPEKTAEPLTWEHHLTGELTDRPVAPPAADDLLDRGSVALPGSVSPGGHGLHPALLDAALRVAGLVESPLVVRGCSDVELHRPGATQLRVRVEPGSGVRLVDAEGRPVARIGDVTVGPAAADRRVEHLHHVAFEAADPGVAPGPVDTGLVDTVVVGDDALGRALGADVAPDLDALFGRLDAPPPARLVLTVRDGDDAAAAAAAALRALQRCAEDPRLRHTELTWVTRDAVAAQPGDRARHWRHAALWGLVRVARTEQPERVLRLVDVQEGRDGDAALLARVLAGPPGEPEWVLRGATAFVPRLRPVRAAPDPPAARALDPEGTVLITGGVGELGGALAVHLVREHGVRRLVLSSRRGADAPAAADLVDELAEAGAVQVRVVACDVSRRDEVAALLDGVEPAHPWTAVFHLAGVLDDGLVPGVTEERLRRVLAPKVRGAEHLDELTGRLDLAAFVLYSSVAGVLGTAGQCGYAAANAVLDALAANRRARGRPGTSLAFGLWTQAGVGMTAHLGAAELGRLRRQGIGALSVAEGHRTVDAALGRSEPYLVSVRLELPSLRHALGDAEPPALLRALLPPRVAQVAEPSTDGAAGGSAAERRDGVVGMVRNEVAAVLGLAGPDGVPDDKALRSLGMDSLTMLELRKRLSTRTNTALPATLVFDYPTVAAIAGLLRGDEAPDETE